MVRIESVRKTYANANGLPTCVCDLQVSTEAELPDIGDEVLGVIIAPGTIAQIIQTGEYATLDDDGSWYDNSGNEI